MRLLSAENLRWVVRHRAWTPYYLKRYWRFAWFRLRHPRVVTEGFVFLGKKIEVVDRPGHGRIVLGKWVHLGDGTRLRAHEGTLRIGDKVVFASDVTVNCYLDVEIGASTLIADWTYICDFDHRTDELGLPIKDQGLVKSPVRIGPDCWLATKVTVTRGTEIGCGSVIGANSVARGNIPPYSVAVGVPATVVRDRIERYEANADHRAYLAGLSQANTETAARLRANNTPIPTETTPPSTGPIVAPNAGSTTPATTTPASGHPSGSADAHETSPVGTRPVHSTDVAPASSTGTHSTGSVARPTSAASPVSRAEVVPDNLSAASSASREAAASGDSGRAGSAVVGRVGGGGTDRDGRDSGSGRAGNAALTGDGHGVTEGFSSYSRVGHYVPEVLGEEIERG